MQGSIYNIAPFDASKGTTIRFKWNGNLATGNRCEIYENDTMNKVYDEEIESYRLDHTINLNKLIKPLENGKQYLTFITVKYSTRTSDGGTSIVGETKLDGVVFYCLSSPSFYFDKIGVDDTINSVDYRFILNYEQDQEEKLNSWQITVYDATSNAIKDTSGVKYNTADMSYVFSGFEHGVEYKIRAIGETVNGVILDTDFVKFKVNYNSETIFSIVNLTNLPKIGSILITSNIVSADGKTEKEAQYIDDKYLNLLDNILVFEEGFQLDSDFSIATYAYNIEPNLPFFKFFASKDESFIGTLTYRVQGIAAGTPISYLELQIQFGDDTICSNYIISNKIPVIDKNTILGICLSRQFGNYGLRIENLGKAKGE